MNPRLFLTVSRSCPVASTARHDAARASWSSPPSWPVSDGGPPLLHPPLAGAACPSGQRPAQREGRQQLVPLIPSVVGRRGDDQTWLRLPVVVAASPILEVPEQTQRVLAAGLLRAEQLCAEGSRAGGDRSPGPGCARSRARRRRLGRAADGCVRASPMVSSRPAARPRWSGVRSTASRGAGPGPRARLRALLETAIAACPAPGAQAPTREVADGGGTRREPPSYPPVISARRCSHFSASPAISSLTKLRNSRVSRSRSWAGESSPRSLMPAVRAATIGA